MKNDSVEVEMQIHHETERAILASDDGDREHAVWLPTSQIKVRRPSRSLGPGHILVTMPEWLAETKRLV